MTSERPDVIPDHVQPVNAQPGFPNAAPLIPAPEAGPMQMAALLVLPLLVLAVAGCAERSRPLTPSELTDDETLYVTRIIVLERVKARLLTDPLRGAALGDSLATAWGDSAQPRTLDLAPDDPARATEVHDLLLRLLAAEHDSLLLHGGVRPLEAAWPAPADSVPGSGFPASARVRNEG